jgi:uncharacterized protein
MMGVIIRILQFPIRVYKKIVSPALPNSCIYFPSCSTYFIDALETHGPIRGLLFGTLRILRCSSFFMGGLDPVERKSTVKNELNKFRIFRRRK